MSLVELIRITELRQPVWLLLALIPLLSHYAHKIVSNMYLPREHFDPKMRYWYLNHDREFLFSNKKQTLIDILFWLLLSISLAGPEYAETYTNESNKKGDSLLVLLDTSNSMNSRDEQPSRLLRAKSELLLLIDKLKTGDKLGLMLFSGSSHLLFPPTNDKSAMRFYIQQIKPNTLPIAGSIYETALLKAQKILLKINNNSASNFILLVSDGDVKDENRVLSNINSLNLKVPVYTLAVGQTINTPVPSNSNTYSWMISSDGTIVTSNRNDQFLRGISDNNKGKFHILTENDNDLDFIYSSGIKSNDSISSGKSNTNWIQLYHSFLLMAILLFFYQRIIKAGN